MIDLRTSAMMCSRMTQRFIMTTGATESIEEIDAMLPVPEELQPIRHILTGIKNKTPRCGVYFLCDRYGIMYIGQSVDVEQRIRHHWSNKNFDSAFYIELPEDDLLRVEAAFINVLKPQLNKARPKPDERTLHAVRGLLGIGDAR